MTDCSNIIGTCQIGADRSGTGQAEMIDYTSPWTVPLYVILDTYGQGDGGAWSLDYRITCQEPPQACCFGDGRCEMREPADCAAAGGTPMGEGTDCATSHCEVVPSEPATWGRIKSGYR